MFAYDNDNVAIIVVSMSGAGAGTRARRESWSWRQQWRQRGGRTDDEVTADIAGDGRAVATKDGRRVGGHQGLR